jgi:sulfide:quinone oxidoreductase
VTDDIREPAAGPPHRVLIAGGGVAALEAMIALADLAPGRVAVTLVAPDEDFVYRPLSTGEPFGATKVASYPLARFATEHGAELVKAMIAEVVPERHVVLTFEGEELSYDTLIVALGASRDIVFEDALTFVDQRNLPGYKDLLAEIDAGRVRSIGFLVPRGVVWPFPLYELALMTASYAKERGLEVELTLVTPASGPLSLFGKPAEDAMRRMLDERGVTLLTGSFPVVTAPGRASLEPSGDMVIADRFVALPQLTGPRLPGLPSDVAGFIPTDEHGRVSGLPDVYAAGDCTDHPFKQGGLASQQADAVAGAIAAHVTGAPMPEVAPPVLRGILLTGETPRHLLAESAGDAGSAVSERALWWPPSKIAGRYLAPALGAADALHELPAEARNEEQVPIEISFSKGAGHPEPRLFDFPPRGPGL